MLRPCPGHRRTQRVPQSSIWWVTASATSFSRVVPAASLTAFLRGHAPSVGHAAEICGVLGLEFYIGPLRTPVDAAPAPPAKPAGEPAFAPGTDPDFLAVEAALADEYQANNDRGRRSLIARFWALFPELRGGNAGRGVRPLARRWGSALLERGRRQPLGARPGEVLEFAAAAGDGSAGDLVPAGRRRVVPPRLAAAPRARPEPLRRAPGARGVNGAHAPSGELDPG